MTTKQYTEPAKGFTCTKCGKEHVFSGYVYAHWRELLTHTCECGQKHEICAGSTSAVEDESAPDKPNKKRKGQGK